MKRITLFFIIFLVVYAYSQDKSGKSSIPEGFGTLQWGTLLSKAKDNIKGKLVYTDEKSLIQSKDGELIYYYGFFYIDPAKVKTNTENKETPENEKSVDEGKLFYVVLKFPYLNLKDVKEKLVSKYGPATRENIIKNQGVVAWDADKTIIVMWVDKYENNPYCRRITYVSKEIAKELNEYQLKMFNKVEREIIQKLGS